MLCRKISRFSYEEMLCTQNSIFFLNFLSLNNFYCVTRIYRIYVIPSCAIFWHAAVYCRLAQLFKISEDKIPSTKKSWNKNQRNNTEDKTESYKYTLSKCCNIEVGYPVLVFVAVLSRK